jgi:hypothetical protein
VLISCLLRLKCKVSFSFSYKYEYRGRPTNQNKLLEVELTIRTIELLRASTTVIKCTAYMPNIFRNNGNLFATAADVINLVKLRRFVVVSSLTYELTACQNIHNDRA